MDVRKKLFVLVFAVLCFLGLSGLPTFAGDVSVSSSPLTTADADILPRNGGDFNPFFGQDHAYSVTFRGNGQAIVFLKVVFSNNGDTPLKELTLRLPRIEADGILAYQIIREKQCVRYDYSRPSSVGDYPCLEYGEPNYSDFYYGKNTYKKVSSTISTDSIKVTLADQIAAQKSGSFILYFRTFGFTKKNSFGAYDYNFESLKVDDTIRSLRVGISPDYDLHMKGATSNVDYFRDSAPVFEAGKMMSAGASFTNSTVDSAIQNIGYGTINKSASNLMPLDSYKVKGSYADSSIKLYAGTTIFVGVCLLVLLIGLTLAVVKIYKSLVKRSTVGSVTGKSPAIGANLALSAVVAFGSATLISMTSLLAYFMFKFISSLNYSQGAPFYTLLLMLIVLGVTVVSLFVPGIFLGIKRGILWGMVTFGFTLFWLFTTTIVTVLILFGIGQAPSIPTPMYQMM